MKTRFYQINILNFTAVLFVVCSVSMPANVMAQNVGRCGWGSKLFDGQRGIAPQVLAVTTNGTSGNQTFAISSGTSGCTQNGVVSSSWRTAMYINSNMNKLARDMSSGEGEAIATLASVMKVKPEHRAEFKRELKDNFSLIFSSDKVSSENVQLAMKKVLIENPRLAPYAASVN